MTGPVPSPPRVPLRAGDPHAGRLVRRVRASRPDLFGGDADGGALVVQGHTMPSDTGGATAVVLVEPTPMAVRVAADRPVGAPPIVVAGRWSTHATLVVSSKIEGVLDGSRWMEIDGSVPVGVSLESAELDALAVVERLLGRVGDYVRTGRDEGATRVGRVRLLGRPDVIVTLSVAVRPGGADGCLRVTAASDDRLLRIEVPPLGDSRPAGLTVEDAGGVRAIRQAHGLAGRSAWERVPWITQGAAVPSHLAVDSFGRLAGLLTDGD